MARSVAMEDKDFQAEQDLRTLIEAEKIRHDKTRKAAAMKKHKEMMAAMKDVEGAENG